MGLSALGIFHTVIGIVAIIAAVTGFIKNGKIDLSLLTGKIYFYFTLVTSLTALGLSKKGGFNPGHIFALFIVVLILLATFFTAKNKKIKKPAFLKIFFFPLVFSCP